MVMADFPLRGQGDRSLKAEGNRDVPASLPPVTADVELLARFVAGTVGTRDRPSIVALDGRSGAGKSTLAAALARRLNAAVLEGDDFYAGGIEVRHDSPEMRAAACIDWTRQRPVLEALRAGREGVWRAFDWEAFDGRLCDVPTRLEPRPIVIIEGVYAARSELADLVDQRILVTAPDDLRGQRLEAREGSIGPWDRQWHEAEEFYFRHLMPPDQFDLVVGEVA